MIRANPLCSPGLQSGGAGFQTRQNAPERKLRALEAAEKFGTGQERQGLKPDIFSIVYGPTKVVPRYKTEHFRSP